MFNKQNFCHIASNNRNDVKAGVFVYKTTDDLATVSVSGYFNEKIVDINLHDLIIHEWHDPTDRTNVEYNLLCVTERTLDNVGTSLIMSNWEKGAEEIIADLDDKYVKKTGDTMSGPLAIKQEVSSSTYSYPLLSLCASYNGSDNPIELGVAANGSNLYLSGSLVVNSEVIPKSSATSPKRLGGPLNGQHWDCVYTKKIYNGYSLNVPQKAGTLATIEDINDALVNAGSSLTNKGVWYAKMYSATVPPAAEDGTNYADFSQTDGQGNPIIVIYERQNGAWAQTETITPPANYNGYVMITSKIWDIPEQSGQQGGQVNWDCVHKTFTPYPKIISFENAALTGNSTVQMPLTPTNDSIVNKGYVDSAIASSPSSLDLFDMKWKDCTISRTGWALSDGNWNSNAAAYQHLVDDFTALGVTAWNAIIVNVGNWWRYSSEDKIGEAHPYAFADEEYNLVYCDTETPAVGVDELYNNYTSAATSLGMLTGGGDYDTVYWPSYETIAGTTVAYFRAQDGHKIVIRGYYDEGKNAVDAIYAATGIAWYYVLDTNNQQFILPRTQFGFVGERAGVGDYVAPELPNIKGSFKRTAWVRGTSGGANSVSGAFTASGNTNCLIDGGNGGANSYGTVNFDASKSSSIYKDDARVQAPATQMYLYFYVGI